MFFSNPIQIHHDSNFTIHTRTRPKLSYFNLNHRGEYPQKPNTLLFITMLIIVFLVKFIIYLQSLESLSMKFQMNNKTWVRFTRSINIC